MLAALLFLAIAVRCGHPFDGRESAKSLGDSNIVDEACNHLVSSRLFEERRNRTNGSRYQEPCGVMPARLFAVRRTGIIRHAAC